MEARESAIAPLGLSLEHAVFMEQPHGAAVAEVGVADRGRGSTRHEEALPGMDALLTRETDVALVVMVADCAPVLICDPGVSVAAVHAGRRGTTLDVVGATLDAMAPAEPDAVAAVVGPAIGGCCYEVPDWLADEVVAEVPSADARTTWGSRSLDLPGAVVTRLREKGVGRIARIEACTACDERGWFSHRASPGVGRQAGVVGRRSRGGHVSASGEAPRFGHLSRFLDWEQ